MAELNGRVVHRGQPLADCQVLAIDEAVLADTVTGADGRWSLTADASLLIARCRGDAIGLIAARPPAAELELSPTHPLVVHLEGMPADAVPQVMLTPLELDGVEPSLLRWIYAPVREAADSVLAAFLARELKRWVQTGRWWITAHYSVSYSARPIDAPDPVSWVAASAVTSDGRPLPARDHGFELDVTGPTDVTIQLAPTSDR